MKLFVSSKMIKKVVGKLLYKLLNIISNDYRKIINLFLGNICAKKI